MFSPFFGTMKRVVGRERKSMANPSLVNLRIDFAFKQLFGTSGSEEILITFLNAMLKDSLESPIQSLQFEDPHLNRGTTRFNLTAKVA